MIPEELSMFIRYQVQQGVSKSSLALSLGISRQTVYNHLAPPVPKERPERPSKLDPYKGYLQARLEKFDLSSEKLYREIRKQGYTGGYGLVKAFVRPLKQSYLNQLTERFETLPGQQAQLDWGECGTIEHHGERKKLYVFTFVLGYSRLMHARFTLSMKQPVLLGCLQEAFERWGIPQEILVDNMKQIVDLHLPGQEAIFNKSFLDFARHYGFMPLAAPPYWARVKGKVESGVKYVKSSFLKGLVFTDLDDLNHQLDHWLQEVAAVRVHGTTHQLPIERYQAEAAQLRPFTGIPAYDTRAVELRKVASDSHISFEGVRYSVHPKAVGQMVQVKSVAQGFSVYLEQELVGQHVLAPKGSMDVTLQEHRLEIQRLNRSRPRISGPAKPRFEQQVPQRLSQNILVPTLTVEMPALSVYDQFLGGNS